MCDPLTLTSVGLTLAGSEIQQRAINSAISKQQSVLNERAIENEGIDDQGFNLVEENLKELDPALRKERLAEQKKDLTESLTNDLINHRENNLEGEAGTVSGKLGDSFIADRAKKTADTLEDSVNLAKMTAAFNAPAFRKLAEDQSARDFATLGQGLQLRRRGRNNVFDTRIGNIRPNGAGLSLGQLFQGAGFATGFAGGGGGLGDMFARGGVKSTGNLMNSPGFNPVKFFG